MKTTLNVLHHQGSDWNRDLDFYIDDLAILTKRLALVNTKKADPKIAEKAGRFLSKFVKLREKVDAMKVALKIREKKVESIVKDNPGQIDDQLRMVNDKLFDRMKDLSGKIAATRFEFNQFLVKNLAK